MNYEIDQALKNIIADKCNQLQHNESFVDKVKYIIENKAQNLNDIDSKSYFQLLSIILKNYDIVANNIKENTKLRIKDIQDKISDVKKSLTNDTLNSKLGNLLNYANQEIKIEYVKSNNNLINECMKHIDQNANSRNRLIETKEADKSTAFISFGNSITDIKKSFDLTKEDIVISNSTPVVNSNYSIDILSSQLSDTSSNTGKNKKSNSQSVFVSNYRSPSPVHLKHNSKKFNINSVNYKKLFN